jgi:Zn-dependent protease
MFVASFVLFLLMSDRDASMEHVAILAAVLFFHEAGHAVAMRAFGYRDVRVFFIPLFGAATSGKPDAGPGWRHGIVLLMGPMPGIVAGAILASVNPDAGTTTLGYAASMLVIVNAFNLLPVTPLDGGALLQLVLFARHRLAEAASRLLSVAAIGALALADESIVLGVVAAFQLVGLGAGWTTATAAAALRGKPLPDRIEDASTELVDDVHRGLDAKRGQDSIAARASWIRLVIERAIAARRAPGVGASIALVLAWVASLVVALVAIVLSAPPP